MTKTLLHDSAIQLLKDLIKIPSFSKEESATADYIEQFFAKNNIPTERLKNNVWAKNAHFDAAKPTILLNSHHDTVRPNKAYTLDPHKPIVKDGKLHGLGSNDAGGPLVSLIATFLHFYDKKELPFNLLMAASAEEEISGKNGMEFLFPKLGTIDFAIVGEPTLMDMAIAEKGLMVIDAVAKGKAGHAARNEGTNAIDIALRDIQLIHEEEFRGVSRLLGPVKCTVTVINAGKQHNVVPAECTFVIDVRSTDLYDNETILEMLQNLVRSELTARSTRLKPSKIDPEHRIVKLGERLGANLYGSPTLSDQALMPCSSFKMGPGDSARSHTADEFIFVDEIKEGIDKYIALLEAYAKPVN